MFRFLRNNKDCVDLLIFIFAKLQPDLSGNPFFAAGKALAKKDWERKAEIAAQKIKILKLKFET